MTQIARRLDRACEPGELLVHSGADEFLLMLSDLDPEAAEETLQYLATYLQRLDGERLQRVREDLLTLIGYGKQQGWSKQELRFFKDFLADFGVAEEETEA